MKPLKNSFFNRDTKQVAEDLLGCFLVRKQGRRVSKFVITETEVYDGFKDRASHASKGKTSRNQIMFGKPGYFYVYFTYGIHWMLNIVTREKDYPAAVLIRGLKPADRFAKRIERYDGPAKLTKALGIDKKLNGKAASEASGLWFEKGIKVTKKDIKSLPRIGVDSAGKYWSNRRLRFVLKNN